jgi:mRNA-degrading endonuclease RelE of RelBE toxin-antitoxin system
MYEVSYTRDFLRHFKKLPRATQIKADSMVSLLAIDFRDSRLHTKKLNANIDLYSFRIGRDYRAVFRFETGDYIKLLDIRHRKDVYKDF